MNSTKVRDIRAPPPPEWKVKRRKTAYVLLSASAEAGRLGPCKGSVHGIVVDERDHAIAVCKNPGPDTRVYVPRQWLADRDPALFGPPPYTPGLHAGPPPLVPILGTKGNWVRVAQLAVAVPGADTRVAELSEFCATKGFRLRCTWELRNDSVAVAVKQSARYPGPTEPFLPENCVRSAFPRLRLGDDIDPVPRWTAYAFPDDARKWLPWNHLEDAGDLSVDDLEDLVLAGSSYSPVGARYGLVRPGHAVEPCKQSNPVGHWFVEAGLAVGDKPSVRDAVHRLLAPGAEQPTLPFYAVTDAEGSFVSVKTLRRVCGETAETAGIFPAADVRDSDAAREVFAKKGAVVSARLLDGVLVQIVGKNKLGGIMVAVLRLRSDARFRPVSTLLGAGHPDLPVEMSAKPHRDRSGCDDEEYRRSAKSTIKSAFVRRLKDKKARETIYRLVDNVSFQSRYGSLLANLHVLRLLEAGEGTLGETIRLDDTWASNACNFARRTHAPKKYATLAETARLYEDDLSALKVDYLAGITNAVVSQASAFVTSSLNAITSCGEQRIRKVWQKGLDTKLQSHVRDGAPLTPGTHPRLVELADRYRRMYVDRGLDGAGKFDVNALSDDARHLRVTRILEVHWRINEDLDDIEKAAIASGA